MLSLTRKKKPGAIVGLDIEAGSIAATELRQNGAVLTRQAINQIARSEIEGLLEDQLDETLGEKAKGLLDKIGN